MIDLITMSDHLFQSVLFPHLKPVLPWLRVDLQKEHLERKTGPMKALENQQDLLNQLSVNGRFRTFGGFGEDRSLLWQNFETHGKPMIHLGVDFNNLPAGEPVHSPTPGQVIHVLRDSSSFNGWGGRVMVRSGDLVFLYGHLDPKMLPEVGRRIGVRERIGVIADDRKNGGWFPHLHLQIMTIEYVQSFSNRDEIDGYAAKMPNGVLNPELYLRFKGASLSLRQKTYERILDVQADLNKHVLVRISGQGTNKSRVMRPNHRADMITSAEEVMKAWNGCAAAYTHGHEVTFAFPVMGAKGNRLGHKGRVQAILSRITSLFTAHFTRVSAVMHHITTFEGVMVEVGTKNSELINHILHRHYLGESRYSPHQGVLIVRKKQVTESSNRRRENPELFDLFDSAWLFRTLYQAIFFNQNASANRSLTVC